MFKLAIHCVLPLRAFAHVLMQTAEPEQSSHVKEDLHCDLPHPHVTREPACNGRHGAGGSITGTSEAPGKQGIEWCPCSSTSCWQRSTVANYGF